MAIDPTNASTVNSKAVQSHIGYDNLANILEANLKTHYDWIFLTLGGWTSVTIPLSGAYGGEWSRLRPVEDELYTDGQVGKELEKTGCGKPVLITLVQTALLIIPPGLVLPRLIA